MSRIHDRDPFRICRGCGCTDDRACPGGCTWALLDYALVCDEVLPAPSGICSTCADAMDWHMVTMANFLCPEAAARLGPEY